MVKSTAAKPELNLPSEDGEVSSVNTNLHKSMALRRAVTQLSSQPIRQLLRPMASATSPANETAMETVNRLIKEHEVLVFSKSMCPFCLRVQMALSQAKLDKDPVYIQLNELAEGQDMQDALLELTGQRTVPNVFVNQKHVGGCDDTLAAMQSGHFENLLQSKL